MSGTNRPFGLSVYCVFRFMRLLKLLMMVLNLFLLSGCHSFFSINENELKDIDKEDVVKITLLNKEIIHLSNIQNIIRQRDKIEFIGKNSDFSIFYFNEINKIAVKKFDFAKTFLTTLFICFGVIGIYVLLSGGLPAGR